MEVTHEIKGLKEEIKRAETDLGRSEGRVENLMKRLKELGVSSTEEAEKKVKESGEQIAILEKEIESDFERLKKEYEW